MTVDVRAKVFCNLGTVIQGNLADEALSAGQGLISCRGQVVLDGLSTPAVGSTVHFGWVRGSTIARIPRTLRVLSSFADPFRGTTTVQLGDKLVYLANLRGAKAEEEEPDGTNGPDPAAYPSSDYDYNAAESCYLPKEGAKPFNFSTPDAASKLTVREEYALAPAKVMGRAPMGIYASSVLSKCCAALGIAYTGQPLTNVFQDDFDLSAGYVQVIDQLLSSESLFGYLTENETLQIVTIDGYGTGPLITTDELIDLSGINQGILPGQTVSVTFDYKRLKDTAAQEAQAELNAEEAAQQVLDDPTSTPEEEAAAQEELDALAEAERQRNWEEDTSVTYNQEYTFTVEEDGATVYSATFSHNPTTTTSTSYDDSNYATLRRSVEKRIVASEVGTILQAVINAKFEAGEIGGAQTGANDTILRQSAQSELEFITEETFEYEEVKEEANNEPQALPPDKLCPDPSGTERVVDEDASKPKPVEKRQIKTTVTRYEPLCSLLAKMNVSGYDFSTYDLGNLPTAPYISEQTITYYDTNQPTGQTKTRVDRYLAHAITLEGQQWVAEKGTNVTTDNQLNELLERGSQLVFSHTEVSIQRDRTFGVQKRPTKEQLQADDKEKDLPVGGGNDKGQQQVDLQQENSTVESSPKTQVPMPLASDDAVVWTADNGYEFKGSNASSMAMRYGRTVNELLRGNRAGVSLQLAATGMPLYPLSSVYLEAGGLTASYKSNGMSWSFNSDGVLCAMDALFVSGISGTGTRWFPVAPGITTLPSDPTVTTNTAAPANSTTTPVGFDPTAPGAVFDTLPTGQAPVYAQSIAPSSGVPVAIETLPIVAGTRSIIAVIERNYALSLPTQSAAISTTSALTVTEVSGPVVPLVIKPGLGEIVRIDPGAGDITETRTLSVGVRPEVVKYEAPLVVFGHTDTVNTGGDYLTLARVYANSIQDISNSLSAQPVARIVDVAVSPDGTRLAYMQRNAPHFGWYSISSNYTFTPQTTPGAQPYGDGQIIFSPRGQHLFTTQRYQAPFYEVFRVTATGFESISEALDVSPTDEVKGFAYSSDDRYLAISYSNVLRVYQRQGDLYATVASAALSSTMGTVTAGVTWTRNNGYLAVATGSSPYVDIFSFDGTALTSVTSGITSASAVRDVQFSPDGTYLALALSSSPYLDFYKRSGSTFTKLTSSVPTSSGAVRAINWTGYSDYFVVQTAFQSRIWVVNASADTFAEAAGSPFTLPADVYSAGSMAVFPMPTVTPTPATDGTETVVTRLGISATSFDPNSPQAFQAVNAAPRLGASPATSYTGWTLIQDANDDDTFSSAVSLPFNVTISGVASNQVFVESNSYLTFGTGSGSIPYDASFPEVEKLLIVPGDFSFQRVYAKIGTNYALLRYEGFSQYTGTTPGSSNIIWEVALTQPDPSTGAQVIEVRMGINDGLDSLGYNLDTIEVCGATTSLASTTAIKNTSYIIEGNSTGATWTFTSGASLAAI